MIPIEHIHPMLVHFPIVFFLTLAALDSVAVFRGASITGRSAVGNIAAGLAVLSALGAISAFALGDAALEIAQAGGFMSEVGEIHETLGTVTVVLFSAWAALRVYLWMKDITISGAKVWMMLLVEAGGAAIVLTTAFYGGTLVYELGVNVARAAQ